jgi:UDP-N-acetyl-D-galactosamine dehydrogenase
VIENTQRDINISLMNELSIIFDRMGIDTREVIEAAGTKWNFHKYYPGLVGGHCISVDPFYLMHKARSLGYEPQVIAAGRRVNDYMPHFIAKKVVQALIENGKNPGECRVLVMGITFKEDVSDIRNTKVVELIHELEDYSVAIEVIDPYASRDEVLHEYGIELKAQPEGKYDALILAVEHKEYKHLTNEELFGLAAEPVILFDLKATIKRMNSSFYFRL